MYDLNIMRFICKIHAITAGCTANPYLSSIDDKFRINIEVKNRWEIYEIVGQIT
jgi:hypothetical protein